MTFEERVDAYQKELMRDAEKQGHTNCEAVVYWQDGITRIALRVTLPPSDVGCLPAALDHNLKVTLNKQVLTTTFEVRDNK